MIYAEWDKQSPINGIEAVDIIGAEQMLNDDKFFVLYDDNLVITSIESVNTVKSILGITTDETIDIIAAKYIEYISTPILAPAQEIANLKTEVQQLQDTIDSMLAG